MGASCATTTKKRSTKSINDIDDVIEPVKKGSQKKLQVPSLTVTTATPTVPQAPTSSPTQHLMKSPSSTVTAATDRSNTKCTLPAVKKRVVTSSVVHRKPQRKQSRLEVFLIQRKEFMQSKGIFAYNCQTTLPPPVISNTAGSSLLLRRRTFVVSEVAFEINSNDITSN